MTTLRQRLKVGLMRWPRGYLWVRRTFILLRFAIGRPHDPDFYAFAHTPADGLFLDVGANSGMSALSFRTQNRKMPILSIEANPFHERDLRFLKRWLPSFDYRIVGAGDSPEDLRLHVPVFRGVPLTGEASLLELERGDMTWWVDENLGPDARADFEFVEVEVHVIPLDSLELHPTIVKIDVEGFELAVLRGLERTLERCRPLLLLETPADMAVVTAYLAEWGYRPCRFDPGSGTFREDHVRGTNVFYAPGDAHG